MTCPGEQFLDFLEDLFRVQCYFHIGMPEDEVVAELNDLLRKDDLLYFVTDFVKETRTEMWHGREREFIVTVAHPQVIMREHEVIHAQAIAPVLEIVRRPEYSSANKENSRS
jgi:hypothetical protein